MMTKLLALVAALSLAACTDDAAPTDESQSTVDVTEEMAADQPADQTGDLCQLLPTDAADPCSHLCDEEGIGAFIPEHTCALFVCHLTDGTTYHAGGCVP